MSDEPATVPGLSPPSGVDYVRFPGQSPDVIEDWEARLGEIQDTQAALRGQRQGELRGKYETIKHWLRHVDSLRQQAEARANFFATLVVMGLASVIVLWTVTSVIDHHPVWPWEMLSIFGAPPPPSGAPHGYPAP